MLLRRSVLPVVFVLALIGCAPFISAAARAQRREPRAAQRKGPAPSKSKPPREFGFIRISTAALFGRTGFMRTIDRILNFGSKVFLAEDDPLSTFEYVVVTDAASGERGLVNRRAIVRTAEELNWIKQTKSIPNRLIRISNEFRPAPFFSSFDATTESDYGSPKELKPGDVLYMTSRAAFTEDVCRYRRETDRVWSVLSALCQGLKQHEAMIVYHYDGKTFKEWDYEDDQSGLKLAGDWTRDSGDAPETYTDTFHIQEKNGQWEVLHEESKKGQRTVEFRGEKIRYETGSLYFHLSSQIDASAEYMKGTLDIYRTYRIKWKLTDEFKATGSREGSTLTIRYPGGRLVMQRKQ